jgi:hypothetical protein
LYICGLVRRLSSGGVSADPLGPSRNEDHPGMTV